ncbi:hypothetical protein SLEP1_g34914 [Rubroshorea leprosula]|uniref:HMA domain-containing protein n=1 Tax=Rubroshorea leprosula TaxID=152421 RepID=A0AAV5KLJ3_9ROSI|nr:hypothetical protein SLEP1_g34914 [Rubroshorea leprosula]
MGEEAKQEQVKAEVPQPEEKKEEKTEEKPAEEGKEEQPPKPPSPFVLCVDLHCVGCAKKIERSIMKIRGVEGVVTDMSQNQVTIKGIVEPQAVCTKIMKKTKRKAKVLSPLPAAEGDPMPEVVTSQVSELTTVELNVDMHCQACADQLKKKILKMKGVQTAVTEYSTGKVMVTGTMDANKLVDYLYRRTGKQVRIVPQPEPEPEKEEAKKPEKPEEKKEEKPSQEAKKEEGDQKGEEKKEEKEGRKKEGEESINSEEEGINKMIYYYQPLYVIEQMPPAPQLFSDENPNACCIS